MSRVTCSVEYKIDEEMKALVHQFMNTKINNEKPSEELCECLKVLQCPFTWKPHNDSTCRKVLTTVEEKLTQAEQEEEEWSAWTTFVLNLILCYEHGKSGAVEFALEKQEECEKIADKIAASGFAVSEKGVGLKHVSLACKVFLFIKSNLFEEAMEHLHCITDIEDMANRDQASVWSVRGAVFLEYGLKGLKESVLFIEKALELDSECAEWHFLLGKSLSRIRRIEDRTSIPVKKEIESFETAVNMSNNTFYMVLLAQTYMDTARLAQRNKSKPKDWKYFCDAMNEQSVEMYRKAMENCKENPYVLGRCAFGFMRLAPPWQDMNSSKICLFKGLQIDHKNHFLNHVAGSLYKRENDFDKAKYYFNRCAENGDYGACLELLEIKQKECASYNPLPDLERYISRFREKPHQEYLLGLLGAYHYFVKNDFNTALDAWLQIVHSDIDSEHLKVLINNWPSLPHPCYISKTIVGEIIRMLDESTCSAEERIKYKTVLAMYRKQHMGLVRHVENMYVERRKYKHQFSEEGCMPPASFVRHDMCRNGRTQHQGAQSDYHEKKSSGWRKK